MRRLVVFGRRLSARFPCPVGLEIARNPPLRVASYVMHNCMRQTINYIILVLLLIINYSCQDNGKLKLTHDFLNGNWFYIDSICDPDPNFGGYNYGEICINDSIFTTYETYPGIGPAYYPYKLSNDSIVFSKNHGQRIDIIDSNNIKFDIKCSEGVQVSRVMSRMSKHPFPLKEFHNQQDLDSFTFEIRKRQYNLLKKENLIK